MFSKDGSGAEGPEVRSAVAGGIEPDADGCALAAARLPQHGGLACAHPQVWLQRPHAVP